MKTINVVSISGGKDSTATMLLALDGGNECKFVYADTGNEHPLTEEYVFGYLQKKLDITVDVVRADFSKRIANKRIYVEEKWPGKGVPDDIVQAALDALAKPFGNPFLDLCLWKGRFPSRMAQFCTQELKRYPLDAYLMALIQPGVSVESWRGIRRDESARRKDAKDREAMAEGYTIVHPIVDWTAQQVVDFVRDRGLNLNPLYSLGMGRVGCMPCINCGKDELSEIAKRFPEHIDRIREWERLVSAASKRGFATFFSERTGDEEVTPAEVFERGNIDAKVKWSMTARGGRQADWTREEPPAECSSVYGLCE